MEDFLKFDLSEFHMVAAQMEAAAKEVPFAVSKTINNAAFKARSHLIEDTWPRSVTVRNRGFLRQALRVEKSNKKNLTAAVVDTLGRGNLFAHANSGVKIAKNKNIAIPTSVVRRTARGVRDNQKPANLGRSFVKNGVLYQVIGYGKSAKIKPMYVLRPSVKIKKSVPFHDDFNSVARREIKQTFAKEMMKAMLGKLGRFVQ